MFKPKTCFLLAPSAPRYKAPNFRGPSEISCDLSWQTCAPLTSSFPTLLIYRTFFLDACRHCIGPLLARNVIR
jgi:hypothetical protein